MAVCSSCGENNPKKKQFCTKCGVILQAGNDGIDIAKDFDSQSFAKYSEDFISKSFAEKKPPPSENKTAPNDQQFSHQASAPPPAQEISRANALKLVAKAGAKAIIKSVSLSLLVLGPGFAMLMMGITIPGMIWLFCGSFGLMAWTYRKPWRLGVISCLIPPGAAGAVYVIQLYLFGAASPPVLLLAGAIAVGLGVGFWRAQTHNVTHADDGGIIAERTIGYLLVWVAAYALTQTMGLLAFNVYAVRAGLLTGAFSTAMLTIVSLVIWTRYRRLVANTIIVVLLSIAGLAEFNVPASAQTSFCDATFRSPYQLWSACKGLSNKGVTYPPLLEILSYKNSNTSDVDSLLIQADRSAEIAGSANASKAVELYIEAARRENPKNLISRRYILGQARKIMFRNNYPAGRLRAIEIEQLKLQSVICAAQKQGFTGLPRFSLEQKNAASCLAQAERALKLAGQTQPQPGKAQPRTGTTTTAGTGTPGPDTPLCWSGISDGYVGPVPGMSENNPSCEFVMSCNEAKTADERGGEVKYVVRGKGYETTGFIEIGGCYQILQPQEAVQNPQTGVVPGNGDNLDRPVNISQEAAATAAAAVATVLIAAGVAVSIAQAIAAAIANALQAGVQLTSEEIQRAVTEALFGLKSESASGETGSGTDPPDAKGNAPPNVSFTERVRPPMPVLQPDGTPFESNDKGQYRVPVGNGEWGWRSRSEAREASATMRREQAQHDGENSGSAPGETGSGTEPPEPESNAPPNVTSRERVRPPTPVYQPDGTAFESNDKGQYWAPDENGDERWMSKREAEDAAAALQAEEDRRKSERDVHDRETEDMLARSRQQAEARNSEERDAEARAKAEQTARAGGGDSPDEGGDGDKGGRIYRDPRYAEPGWDNTGFGWAANFFGDFFGGVGKDSSDLITNTPGALKGAARAAGSALANVDNWKSAAATGSEIGMYLTALQRGDIDRLGKAGSTITNVARQAGEAVYNDPGGSAVAVVETVLGADNWRKATDPNVPVTERFGRAVWWTIDTGGLVVGGVGLAAKGVGKAGSLLRSGDALADAAKVARAADKVGDAAGAARTADKIGDTAAAARTADKTADGSGAAARSASKGDEAAASGKVVSSGDDAAGLSSMDDGPGKPGVNDPPPRKPPVEDDLPPPPGGADDAAKPAQRAARETVEEAAETAEQIKNRYRNAISQMDDKIDELKGQLTNMDPSDPSYGQTQERITMFEDARKARKTDILNVNTSRMQQIDGELSEIRRPRDIDKRGGEVATAQRQRILDRELDLLKQESRTIKSDHVAAQVNVGANADDVMPAGLSRQKGSFDVDSPGGGRLPETPSEVQQAVQMHVDTQSANSQFQSWTTRRRIAVSEGGRGYGGNELAVAHIPRSEYQRMLREGEAIGSGTVSSITSRSSNVIEQEILVHRVRQQNWRMETPEVRNLFSGRELPIMDGVPVYTDPNGNEFVILYRAMNKSQFPRGIDFLK